MMYGHGFWGMGFGWGWIFWIILIGAGVWLAVAVVRNSGRHGRSAEEIVKERYARGEIPREEFEQKLHDLGGH